MICAGCSGTGGGAAPPNRPELTVSIALGRSTQISLFVAPVLVLLSYWISPVPMDLHFSAPAVLMILLSTFRPNDTLSRATILP
jgi:Ca2+:H+ antiporter